MGRGSNVNQEIITVIQCSEHCMTLLDTFIPSDIKERESYILCVAGLVSCAGAHHHQGDHSEEEHLSVRHPLHLQAEP